MPNGRVNTSHPGSINADLAAARSCRESEANHNRPAKRIADTTSSTNTVKNPLPETGAAHRLFSLFMRSGKSPPPRNLLTGIADGALGWFFSWGRDMFSLGRSARPGRARGGQGDLRAIDSNWLPPELGGSNGECDTAMVPRELRRRVSSELSLDA